MAKASKHGWSVQDQVRRGLRKLGRSRCCTWVLLIGQLWHGRLQEGAVCRCQPQCYIAGTAVLPPVPSALSLYYDVPHPGQAAFGQPAMSCMGAASILTYSSALQTLAHLCSHVFASAVMLVKAFMLAFLPTMHVLAVLFISLALLGSILQA